MKFHHAYRTSIALTATIAALAACSGSSGGASGGGGLEKTNIVVDAFPAIDSAGLFIAQQEGLFKAQGLNVTIKLAATSQAAITGQLAGEAYRRPANNEDVESLMEFYAQGRRGHDFESGIRAVVQAVLASPNFL